MLIESFALVGTCILEEVHSLVTCTLDVAVEIGPGHRVHELLQIQVKSLSSKLRRTSVFESR